MGTITLKSKYRHSEDCIQEGCPFHEAKFTYQTTSDAYLFETGYGKEVTFERGELEVFLKLLADMHERDCGCVDIGKYINAK